MTSIDWHWSPTNDFGELYVGGANILNALSRFERTEIRILEGKGSDTNRWRFLLAVDSSNAGYSEAFSPYGYSEFGNVGPLSMGGLADLRFFLQSEEIIDLFIRHNPWQHSQTIFPSVLNHRAGSVFALGLERFTGDREADLAVVPQKRRSTVRRSIKNGLEIVITPAYLASTSQQSEFARIYRQTMHSSGARKFYLFNPDFFKALFLDPDRTLYLFEAVSVANRGALASSLFVGGAGRTAHYFLSGALPEGKELSAPDAIIYAAAQHFAGLNFDRLNFGGATASVSKGLGTFKKSWSNFEEPYFVSKIVCDTEKYARHRVVAAGEDQGTFLLRDLHTSLT